MKSLLKKSIGEPLINLSNAVPKARPILKKLGLRTTEELFGEREVTIPTSPGRFLKLTHLSDNYLSFQVFWRGIGFHEPVTALVLQELVKPGHTFIDIGANVGFFSLVISHTRPEVKVIAFEPNPKNFQILQANVAANDFKQIRCEPIALSNQDGTARLFFNDSDMSASLVSTFQKEYNTREDWTEVPTVTLDSYLSRNSIQTPLVVKVDVEGHEEALLEGAKETLATQKPDLILEVLKDFSPASTLILKNAGYRFYPITNQGYSHARELKPVPPNPFRFWNYLISAKPESEIAAVFQKIQEAVRKIDFYQTSKYFGAMLALGTRWQAELFGDFNFLTLTV